MLDISRNDYERLRVVQEELDSLRITASIHDAVEDWPEPYHEFANDPFTYLFPDDNLRHALADKLDIALDVIHHLEVIYGHLGYQHTAKAARMEMPYLFYDDQPHLNEAQRYILRAVQDKLLDGNAVARIWSAVASSMLHAVQCTPQLRNAEHRGARK